MYSPSPDLARHARDRGRARSTRKCQGSALIVAMVFLIILTILGLSSMNTSRLEVKMANNTQFADQAFQAAESGIDLLLATPALRSELNRHASSATGFTQSYSIGTERAQAAARYLSVGFAPGYSVDTPALHYQITSTGVSAGGGEAQNVQGFYVIGPSG